MHLVRGLFFALGCAACGSTTRTAPMQTLAPAAVARIEARRSLGLETGVVAHRLFSASYIDEGATGRRSESWTCAFTERVARVVEPPGSSSTDVDIERTVDPDACRPPAEDW